MPPGTGGKGAGGKGAGGAGGKGAGSKGAGKGSAKALKVSRAAPAGRWEQARQIWRWIWRSAAVGGALGALVVALGFYRYALERVDSRFAGGVHQSPGRIYGGPVEVWEGLRLSAEELAADLTSAGYAQVASPSKPGDFSVTPLQIRVVRRPADYPGYAIKGGEVRVDFRQEGGAKEGAGDVRVAAVTGGRALLPPPVLGSLRGEANEERSPVPLERIPLIVQQAVMAMEDARFYQHPGVDPIGLARAMAQNLRAGRMVQGGSSLTQQLAKNLFLTPERSWRRKLEEVFLALALEQRLGKKKILGDYLNEIYLGQAGGGSLAGVDAAARAWFGRSIDRAGLPEAALIAGVISAPNTYSPLKHPEAAKTRRDIALGRLAATGVITAAVAAAEQKKPLDLHPNTGRRQAEWASDVVVDLVEAELGEGMIAREGLAVHTTIHLPLQRAAERALAEGLAELEAAHPKLAGIQGAIAVVRARDGAVLALVGGRDYGDSFYNRAWLSARQVGSTIKPLTLLAAFERDRALSPATILEDAPLTLTADGKDWSPKNYDGSYVGAIPIRRAIATSRNIPAVKLAMQVGMPELERRWKAIGLQEATRYPSSALGSFGATPLQMAAAYAIFANVGATGGIWHAPFLVRGIAGDTGLKWEPSRPADVNYSSRAAWLAADVLRSVLTEGTGKGAAKYGVGGDAGGKSGTTDRYTDAWFVGFSSEISIAVWVGFDQQRPTGLTGSQAALPVWARLMAWSGTSGGESAPAPAGLQRVEVCEATGAPPCPGCEKTREEWFVEGRTPESACGAAPLIVGRGTEGAGKSAGESTGKSAGEGEGKSAGEEGEKAEKGAMKRLGEWLGIGKKD